VHAKEKELSQLAYALFGLDAKDIMLIERET